MSSAPTPPPLTGHCLCGRVRYRAKAAPLWVGYCPVSYTHLTLPTKA